jgi:hypothetical protein
MKKHLIAAAVAGAFAVPAMAQVTVSGTYGVAYGKGLASAQGLRVSDGHITFSAAEDLGGGMKAGASLELRLRGRVQDTVPAVGETGAIQDIGVGGRNASVSLSGPFGTIDGGAIEFSNGIYARGSAGAPIALPDELNRSGLVLATQGLVDYVRYTTPALAPGLTSSNKEPKGVESLWEVGNSRTLIPAGSSMVQVSSMLER